MMIILFITLIKAGGAHDQSTRDYSDALKKAKAVAVAEVEKSTKNTERCSTTFRFTIRIVESLKGTIEVGKTYPFSYTVHHWKRATFPWQEDCPSVHYRLPPIAENMGRGARIIITLENWPPCKCDAVTSTKDIRHLEDVKRFIVGK